MHLGVKRLSEDGMVADLGHVRMFGGKFCNMVRHERLFIIFSVYPIFCTCSLLLYPSGLCFAGMLIHFRSGKFQALHMSTF